MRFPWLSISSLMLSFMAEFEQVQPKALPAPTKVVFSKDDMVEITGHYRCRGSDNGKNYSGVAVIVKKNDVYFVTWITGGTTTFGGMGVRTGNTLAVSWNLTIDTKGVIKGSNLYTIEPGKLIGRWVTIPSNGRAQREVLIFREKLDPEEE